MNGSTERGKKISKKFFTITTHSIHETHSRGLSTNAMSEREILPRYMNLFYFFSPLTLSLTLKNLFFFLAHSLIHGMMERKIAGDYWAE
jgi:hypothetical protein